MKGTIVERSGSYGAKLTVDQNQMWLGTFGEREHARAAVERTARSPYPSITISGLVSQWTQRPEISADTHKNNAYNIASFERAHGKRPAASYLRLEAVQWTQGNFGVARFAKALFEYGRSVGIVEDNPFAGLAVTKKAKPKMCPTPQQVRQAALVALDLHSGASGVLLHDMVLVSSQTGLRLHELSGLRSEHVEVTPTGMTLHVVGKGQRYRQVPVPPQVAHIIQRRMVSRLIFGRAGTQLTRQSIHKLMKPVREQTGLVEMNWHLLRHHYATQLANNGVLDRDAALVMFGHTNPRLLHDVYSHPDRAVAVSRVADQLAVAA